MSDYQYDVDQFMLAAGQMPLYGTMPQDIEAQAKLYMDLITEEYNETLEAYKAGDKVEIADGLADMVWVIMGMATTLDIPFDRVWNEVRASNMSKCIEGKVIKDPDTGKVLKPDGYFRPDIAKVLSS